MDPQKQSVIERFSLLGEFGIRGPTVLGLYMGGGGGGGRHTPPSPLAHPSLLIVYDDLLP